MATRDDGGPMYPQIRTDDGAFPYSDPPGITREKALADALFVAMFSTAAFDEFDANWEACDGRK